MNQMSSENSNKNSNHHQGHILVVSCPLQGHAAPLIKLSHQITKFGAKVTFLTTDSTRTNMMNNDSSWNNRIEIISISDGLENEDDRKDQKKLHASVRRVMPCFLKDFLNKSYVTDRISGVIIDSPLAFMSEIPKSMGIKVAIFWCSTPGCLALGLQIPQLIEDKFIDNDGTLLQDVKIKLLPNMPLMSATEFTWYFPADMNVQRSIFHMVNIVTQQVKSADWILCNWFHELEPSTCNLMPTILSIGPLLANGQSAGSFCLEDSSCLAWLDKQPKNSVVYVAFGSTTRFSQEQIDELAKGLELLGRPFLWVAWSGLSSDGAFSDHSKEFQEHVGDRGKIVEWAPQEVVLAHPSIACFITHCGWSSFMESLSMGVPLLCWPYFGDQLYTQTCICDAWKVGVMLKNDESSSGIISRYEIMHKVDQLLCDGKIKENALKLKIMAGNSISEGGSSFINIEYLIQQMKC